MGIGGSLCGGSLGAHIPKALPAQTNVRGGFHEVDVAAEPAEVLVVGPQLRAIPHCSCHDDVVGEGQPAGIAEASSLEGEWEAERRHVCAAHDGHRLRGGGVSGDLQQVLRHLEDADDRHDELVGALESRPVGFSQGRRSEDFEPAA